MIYIAPIETPLGTITACSTEKGICFLEFSDKPDLESDLKNMSQELLTDIQPGTNIHLDNLNQQLVLFFKGLLREFSLPLIFSGTPFQQLVWKHLLDIPYGSTRTYMQQAIALKNPEAIRAVASANGSNKIYILVPCHRVIGSEGRLTGYGGGLWRKKWLLELESKNKQLQLEF